jgi:hypothetical protein
VLLSRVPKVLWGMPEVLRRKPEVLWRMPEVFWRVPFRLSEISLGMFGVPQLPQVL